MSLAAKPVGVLLVNLGTPDAPRTPEVRRYLREFLSDPRVSPLQAAAKLPPSHVAVGSADVLVGQSERLVKALATAGVPYEHFVDDGMPHGYIQMEFLDPARPAINRMVDFLRRTS